MEKKPSSRGKITQIFIFLIIKFNKLFVVTRIIILALILSVFAIVGILVLSRINVNTEATIDIRADSLSFDQLDNLSWFGDSITCNWLIIEGAKIELGTSWVDIKTEGNSSFKKFTNIDDLEIKPQQDNSSSFSVKVYKSMPDSSGLPMGNIELNAVDIYKGARTSLRFLKNPIKIELNVKNGTMKGKINTNNFYLIIRNGQIKSMSNKNISFNGDIEVKGKLIPILPLKFETKTNGKITIIKPYAEKETAFLNEGGRIGAINNMEIIISRGIDPRSKKIESFIKYSAVGSALKRINEYSAGKRVLISSKNNFDINLLKISSLGIDFISEVKSRNIYENNILVSPSLLESIPRLWICIGAILFYLLDKIIIEIFLRKVTKE